MAKVEIPTVKLNDGREMPALGYGTWLGLDENNEFLLSEYPRMVDALSYAIDIGYRHVDTAHLYRVEPEVGAIINKKIAEGVPRKQFFVTTKVWNHNHREADVVSSVRGSLKRMGLEYLDLVLVHWPMAISQEGVDEKIDYLETWRGFEKALELGLTRSIGVSNFNLEQMKRLLTNCKVKPVVNQIEVTLNLGQSELVEYCRSQDVVIVAYSPFGTLVPNHAFDGSPEPKINNPDMLAIGKKHGKSVTQVCLRYLYQRGIVSIPKTSTKTRVLENASIFDFQLDATDVATIEKFDIGFRRVTNEFWQPYTYFPFEKLFDNPPPIPKSLLVWKNGVNSDIE